MTTAIFVHGTGGRKKAYAETFWQIERSLQACRSDAKLISCLWGDTLGAKLNADGASIPTYKEAKGGQQPTPEEENIRLWKALYEDPFYEMRLLGLRPLQSQKIVPGQPTPSQELKHRVEALSTNTALQSKLNALGIGSVFLQAYEIITASKPFRKMLETASSPLDGDYAAIARAIVSAARILCKEQDIYPSLLINTHTRDQAVAAIAARRDRYATTPHRSSTPAWVLDRRSL